MKLKVVLMLMIVAALVALMLTKPPDDETALLQSSSPSSPSLSPPGTIAGDRGPLAEHFVSGGEGKPPATFSVNVRDTTADGCGQYPNSFAIESGQSDFVTALQQSATFQWAQAGLPAGPIVKFAGIRPKVHFGKDIVTYAAPDSAPKPYTPATIEVGGAKFETKIMDTSADGLGQFADAFAILPGQTGLVDALKSSSSFRWSQAGGVPGPLVGKVEILSAVHFGKDVVRYKPPAPIGPKSYTAATFTITYPPAAIAATAAAAATTTTTTTTTGATLIASPPANYIVEGAGDRWGGDMQTVRDASLADVAAKCDAAGAACVGFSYRAESKVGILKRADGLKDVYAPADGWQFYAKRSSSSSTAAAPPPPPPPPLPSAPPPPPPPQTPQLAQGQAVRCTDKYNPRGPGAVYRHENGLLRHYTSPQVASSWDPSWDRAATVDCMGMQLGANMPMAAAGGATATAGTTTTTTKIAVPDAQTQTQAALPAAPVNAIGSEAPLATSVHFVPLAEQGSIQARIQRLSEQVSTLANEFGGVGTAGVPPIGLQSPVSFGRY